MDALTQTTVLFTLALALALVLERLIEVVKAIYDLIDSTFDGHLFWTRQTARIQKGLNRKLRSMEYLEESQIAKVLDKLDELFVSSQSDSNHTVPVLSGDLVRSAAIKIATKVLAMILGVLLAFTLDINLIALWSPELPLGARIPGMQSPVLQTMITGIIIGLGTSPVHKLISAIDKKRNAKRTSEEKVAA